MPKSYQEALDIVNSVAPRQKITLSHDTEELPITNSLGRIAVQPIVSPRSTPPFDTSAMDGFAVNSMATSPASEDFPVISKVRAVMAAGSLPVMVSSISENGMVPCVEIMTGAQFPQSLSGEEFDACVPIEYTTEVVCRDGAQPLRRLTKPVLPRQHRRLAGSDFPKGYVVLRNRRGYSGWPHFGNGLTWDIQSSSGEVCPGGNSLYGL